MSLKLKAIALVALLAIGGLATAGVFFPNRQRCRGGCSANRSNLTSQIVIGPCVESKEETAPVPQPWSPISEEGSTFSQQPDTVLEPVPGTGSKLLTGPKVPDKITLTPDQALLDAIKGALKAIPQQPAQVPITLPMEPETSQRLSRISMLLEILLWLGGATFGGSFLGKLGPLVVRVVDGLRSATPAQSPTPPQTPGASS